MGIETIIGIASLATGVAGAVAQKQAQDKAASAQKKSAAEQAKARQEQQAGQAAQAAQERRAQIREERARRARILQSSENTGVGISSGSLGATGSLATELGANLGANLGAQQRANNISSFNQNAADYLSSAQSHINTANTWGQVGSLSTSIFNSVGGFKNFSTYQDEAAPVENRSTIFQG